MAEEVCEHRMFQDFKIIERFAWSRLALNGDFRYNLGRYALGIRKM